MRAACVLLVAALLAGCASQPPPRRVALDAVCVSDVAGLRSRQIPVRAPDVKKRPPFIDFADVGECLENGGTRTAATLFALPDTSMRAHVALTVRADVAATLATTAMLLDADYRPVRSHGFGDFVRRGTTYTLDIFLNPGEGGSAAYLLLTPDAGWVGMVDESTRGGSTTGVIPAGPVMFAYTSGHEAKIRREMTDAGSFLIELVPLTR